MAMPDTARRYTVDEVLAFPNDGNRYELVHGELLVTPAPGPIHQYVVGRLYVQLVAYVADLRGVARVFLSPADISWDRHKLVQPDLFVVPPDEVSDSWTTYRTLLLAVEVVSPSSAKWDRVIKRRLYQEQRVDTYWIVDPEAQVVEVWHPNDERPEIVTDVLKWRVTDEGPELEIDLNELFSELPS
jgi:Uma2 family endonuclease